MASIAALNRFLLAVGTFVAGSIYDFGFGLHHRQGGSSSPSTPTTTTTTTDRTDLAQKDRIVNLPGLMKKNDGNLNFDQFSGYLQASDGRHVFYWYVESQSNPKDDPLVFWTNGGPGCSGMFGFGTEHGPYFIDRNGDLSPNPYSWNKVANMLYVEVPAGVGFSYTDTKEDRVTGDDQTAQDNYHLILDFLDRFPERRSNPLHIASESYGGHYMPQLALEILRHSNSTDDDDNDVINLKGFVVGNPYVELYTNLITQFEMFYSHGLLAKPLFDKWKKTCKNRQHFQSMECQNLMYAMYEQFDSDSGINIYGLDYPVCLNNEDAEKNGDPANNIAVVSSQTHKLMDRHRSGPPFLPPQDKYRPCAELHLTNFLNDPKVRAALHIRADESYKWQGCGGVEYSDADAESSVVPLYQELVSMAVKGEHDLSMLVFSGDDDSVCSTAGTQDWIWDLGVSADPKFTWQAWKVNGQTTGFVTNFALGQDTDASFTFVTVHGAGHEVPAFRPMEALELFRRYLEGEW